MVRCGRSVVQTHHITYDPVNPLTVRVWKGEHFVLTLLGRRKKISSGFCFALRRWLDEHESSAIELKDNPTLV